MNNNSPKPLVIALEEHYWDPDLLATFPGREGKRVSDVERRLLDMGELRLREMDEAGIDIQVLSHGAPGTQKLAPELATRRRGDQRPTRGIHPDQSEAFSGSRPAADTRYRGCGESLSASYSPRYEGRMVHGLTNGKF